MTHFFLFLTQTRPKTWKKWLTRNCEEQFWRFFIYFSSLKSVFSLFVTFSFSLERIQENLRRTKPTLYRSMTHLHAINLDLWKYFPRIRTKLVDHIHLNGWLFNSYYFLLVKILGARASFWGVIFLSSLLILFSWIPVFTGCSSGMIGLNNDNEYLVRIN